MQLMAQELRHRGYNATAASYQQNWLGHVNDINLGLQKSNGRLRTHLRILLFTLWTASNYDIFHFFWGTSLMGFALAPHLDLPFLRKMGKKLFVHFRGSDLVNSAYYDYLRAKTVGNSIPEPPISRPDQLRSLRMWRRFANRLLVSEPGLLRIVPEAELVPQAIDLDYWSSSVPLKTKPSGALLRIVHAPTSRQKKGTEFVERSVGELSRQGYPIELVLAEKIPAKEVRALYETADMSIDQLLYGWHGKFSAELMALGKPVICYLDGELRKHRPDIPIVNACPQNLTEKLKELITDVQLRHDLALRGQVYARKHHDVKKIMNDCLRIYAEAF